MAKAKDGYNRNPQGKGGFKKNHRGGPGRPVGSVNKASALFKDQLGKALAIAGEIKAEEIDPQTRQRAHPYLDKANGDWGTAYLVWAALHLPQDFLQHLSKLIPYQFQHSGQHIVEHRHQHEHAHIVKLLGGRDLSQLTMAELSAVYAEAIKPPPANQLKLVSGSNS